MGEGRKPKIGSNGDIWENAYGQVDMKMDLENKGVDWEFLLLQVESWQDRERWQGLMNTQTQETGIGN